MKNYSDRKDIRHPEMLWFDHRKTCIKPEDVVYLKSCDNYTKFYLENGRNFLASQTMKKYESKLLDKGQFARIHRGVLLNMKYLMNFEQDDKGSWACLSTGEKIYVSRRKIKNFSQI